MPVVMAVAVIGMVALMLVAGMARNPMTFLFPLMMVISMVGMVSGGAGSSTDMSKLRRDFQRHLSSIRRAIAKATEKQREVAIYEHPHPEDLWQVVRNGRSAERGYEDSDFLTLRVGLGTQRPLTPVIPPQIPAPEKLDPVSAVALREVIRAARQVHGLPVAVDIGAFPIVSLIDGTHVESARALIRSLVSQIVAFHSPADCAIAIVGTNQHWQWLKWVPHHWHPTKTDAAGPARLTASECASTLELLDSTSAKVRIIIVDTPDAALDLDALAPALADDTSARTVVLAVGIADTHPLWHAAMDYGLALRLADGRLHAETAGGLEEIATADTCGEAAAEELARQLCRRHAPSSESESAQRGKSVLDELNLAPPPAHLVQEPRLGSDRLRIPIGHDTDGQTVYVDFKESAEGGVGPHGLCVGATGSGKSEFLRLVVAGLAATHPPEQLNFVLVDFKGGATFLGLEELPHTSAVITNLEDELILVDRMQDAIRGEMTRRQELLRAAGNFSSVSDYEAARRAGRSDLTPLPALMIVVDEFSELLSARPEFAELFVAVGRLGRSLHIHLLLASQRLEEGRLRGLESHLSYRVGLKTFSAAESRSVLGTPDAYHLPAVPGMGYLKTTAEAPRRFRAAYVSGKVERKRAVQQRAEGSSYIDRPVVFQAFNQVIDTEASVSDERSQHVFLPRDQRIDSLQIPERSSSQSPTVLKALVAGLKHVTVRAHRVWLPPLPAAVELAAPQHPTRLVAEIGIVDKPLQQRQEMMRIDMRTTGGHVAVVGAPRSGKTTALRTLILALAQSTPAAAVHFYVVDCGAGALADLVQLPHVAGVAHRNESEKLRRTIGFMSHQISVRQDLYRQNGWYSAQLARDAGVADLVLVIDGWPTLNNEHSDLGEQVQWIIAEGLAVGIHVVLTVHRWSQLRPSIRDLMGSRIELRQAEAIDSMIDRKAALLVPEAAGRGVAPGGYAMLVATSQPADTQRIAQECMSRGDVGDAAAPTLKLLPRKLTLNEVHRTIAELPANDNHAGAIPIGVAESGLQPVFFWPSKDRHLLIYGSAGSGRTNMLALVARGLQANARMKFVVIDYRRGLLEAVPEQRLAGYAGSAALAGPMIAELANVLANRMPPSEITPARLKARDWWSGPEITLLVDDYDLVAAGRNNPLLPLAEFIPHAADIGLTIVSAARISSALRSLHDPIVGAAKDQGATALILDGTKEDGPILGIKPTLQPPGRGMWVPHGKKGQVIQTVLLEASDEVTEVAGMGGTDENPTRD